MVHPFSMLCCVRPLSFLLDPKRKSYRTFMALGSTIQHWADLGLPQHSPFQVCYCLLGLGRALQSCFFSTYSWTACAAEYSYKSFTSPLPIAWGAQICCLFITRKIFLSTTVGALKMNHQLISRFKTRKMEYALKSHIHRCTQKIPFYS